MSEAELIRLNYDKDGPITITENTIETENTFDI